MKKSTLVVILVLVAANCALLWKNYGLVGMLAAASPPPADSTNADISSLDMRGMYAYPGFGKGLAPFARQSDSVNPHLTLAIFFSAKTQCSMTLGELPVYKRLLPILRSRGQVMMAITSTEDSLTIDSLLRQDSLRIPIASFEKNDQGIDIEKMGLSHYMMPFKVIYDSSFDAIYMRSADNSPETQASFERAVLRLSALVADGKL